MSHFKISLCYGVSIGEERVNGIKTICCSGDAGGSAGVKYRHGAALVSFSSLDMWVAGVGSVLPVGQKYKV